MKNILESHENMQQGLKKHCGMLLTDATAPVVLNSIDPNSNLHTKSPIQMSHGQKTGLHEILVVY